jgi:FecR protein
MFMRSRQRCVASRLLLAASGAVLLPALYAQPKLCGRAAATVLVESGQVSVLKDNYPNVLNPGDAICVQQTVTTGPDSYAKFQLEDNTTIELFANSKMVFHGNSPSLLDMLYVWIGHVKIFEEHSKGENSKKVTTPTAVISVRGTVYDVAVEDDDGTTYVTVDEGAVEVRNQTAPGPSVLLNPGDSIRVFRGQSLVPRQVAHNDIWRVALKAAQNAIYQVVYGRANVPGGIPGGAGGVATSGSPGDKKPTTPGTGTGTGTTNGAPPPPSGGGH